MRGMSSSRWVKSARLVAALGLGLGVTAIACSSAEKLSGEGGSCSLVTDCQDGLVCVPKSASQPNGSRICSNNPALFVPEGTGTAQPDGGGIPTVLPEIDAQPIPDALASDGGHPQDATTTIPEEAAPPPPMEASAPPPMEASTLVEASAPISDASAHD
jgi:hypothetical protein